MRRTNATAVAAMLLLTLAAVACEEDVEELAPIPAIEGPPPAAPARENARLKIDQLHNSIAVVAGDTADGDAIDWSYTINGEPVSLFNALGSTLGNPDYLRITTEPAVPDAMYIKFGADIALNVCSQMAEADAAAGQNRTLSRFAAIDGSASDADIEANIRYLNLRFLGERIAEDDSESIALLRDVYDAGLAAASSPIPPIEGWRAVCVALLQSPAFHIY